MGLVIDKIKGPLAHIHKIKASQIPVIEKTSLPLINPNTKVFNGYLYNWFAAFDSRNICPDGWKIPVGDDFFTLVQFLDPQGNRNVNTAGIHLKSDSTTAWKTTGGINNYGFNAVGAGYRDNADGNFKYLGTSSYLWSQTPFDTSVSGSIAVLVDGNGSFGVPKLLQGTTTAEKQNGLSIRLVKNSTSLTNGQTGTMTGNDGTVYETKCIGTQEWITKNLCETKYRNGDLIPVVTNPITWIGLTTGAMCAYDNDIDHVQGIDTAVSIPVSISDIYNTNSDIWSKIKTTLKTYFDSIYDLTTKVDKVTGKGLSTEDYTTAEKSKLAGIDLTTKVDKVTGKGLSTEDYTTVEKAKLAGIDLTTKVDKVTGKGLSTEDYTTAEKSKLAGIDAAALSFTLVTINANTTGAKNNLYIFTATCTLTLPAGPSAGDRLKFSNLSNTTTPVIARNGAKIMGLSEDLTLDKTNVGGELFYSGATYGWIIL